MNRGSTVFAQFQEFVPFGHFELLVDVYQANKGIRESSACNQIPAPKIICVSPGLRKGQRLPIWGLRADQTMLLATLKSKSGCLECLRRMSFRDPEPCKHLVFLTNLFELQALTIAAHKRAVLYILFK